MAGIAPPVNLKSFMFAFSLTYSNPFLELQNRALIATERYFNITYTYSVVAGTKFLKVPFQKKYCTGSDFHGLFDKEVESNRINTMLCPVTSSGGEFIIEGGFQETSMKYFTIELGLTEYAKNHMEELKNEMLSKPMQMSMFFTDQEIDYEKKEDPVSQVLFNFYTGMDFNFLRTVDIYAANLEFKRDDNIIVEDVKKTKEPILDKIEEKFRFFPNREEESVDLTMDSDKDVFGRIRFLASKRILQMERKYQKFPSFIADISSILEELFVIFIIIVGFFERRGIEHRLIREMFKYKGSKKYDYDYFKKVFTSK